MTTPEELDALQERLARVSLGLGISSTTTLDSAFVRKVNEDITALRTRVAELEAGLLEQKQDATKWFGEALDQKHRAEAAEAELARRGQGVLVSGLIELLLKDHEAWARAKGRNPIDYTSKWRAAANTLHEMDEARIRAALVSPGDGWRSMDSAPKDRTPILAQIRSDLATVKPNYGFGGPGEYAGRFVVIHHPGLAEDGFDIGWSLSGPFGHGLGSDDVFSGWQPLPAPPASEGA